MGTLPVSRPDLSGRERQYLLEAFDSGWISGIGPFVRRFEDAFAEKFGVRRALCCANGTVALHMALLALGVKPGDEVIVPDLTYVATANAVSYCGATPVFADCEEDTWCVSEKTIAPLITPRTAGVIPVHLYGHPCDMDAINALAASRGLFVLEDAAEAHGAGVRGRPVGSMGAAATFSFYANKILTTGEGGMIATNDDALDRKMRLLRGQGMDPQSRFWFPILGYNYRLTNLQAAIGLGQLERVDEKVERHRRIAGWYREELAGVPGLRLPVEKDWARNVYWLFSVVLEGANSARRDAVMLAMAEAGVETRPFFYPMHTLPMYTGCRADCPVATRLAAGGINLPTFGALSRSDAARAARALGDAMALGRASA
jgi:perosamine synthetase